MSLNSRTEDNKLRCRSCRLNHMELGKNHVTRERERESVQEPCEPEFSKEGELIDVDPINLPGLKGTRTERECYDCGRPLIYVNVNVKATIEPADTVKKERRETTAKSRRSAKKQRQKAKAKATKEAAQIAKEIALLNSEEPVTPFALPTTLESQNSKATKGREKRMIRVVVDGRPMFMLRCPVCHNKPVEGNCIHCEQRVCAHCLEDHLDPWVKIAIAVLQLNSSEESSTPVYPALDEGFRVYASQSNTENRFTSLSESVKLAIYKYVIATKSVCPGSCSKDKHQRSTIHPELIALHPENTFVSTPVKDDALSMMALALLKETFTKDENFFFDFVTNYMKIQVIPYEAQLIANAMLRFSIEHFQASAGEILDEPLGTVRIANLVDFQGECNRYSCMFAQLQAAAVCTPSSAKIQKSLMERVLEKIRYVRYEKALYSATLDNQILFIERLKTLRFVEICDVSENPDLKSMETYKFSQKNDPNCNQTIPPPDTLDVLNGENNRNEKVSDTEEDDTPDWDEIEKHEPVYFTENGKTVLSPSITKTGTHRIHHFIKNNVKKIPKPERVTLPVKISSPKKESPKKDPEAGTPSCIMCGNGPIEVRTQDETTGETTTRQIYMGPNTDFSNPKVQQCIKNLPEMVAKVSEDRAIQEKAGGNGAKKKNGASNITLENNSYTVYQKNIGRIEGNRFILASSDSDEDACPDLVKKSNKKKGKTKKMSPKPKEPTNENTTKEVSESTEDFDNRSVICNGQIPSDPPDMKLSPKRNKPLEKATDIKEDYDNRPVICKVEKFPVSTMDCSDDQITMSEIWESIDCVD